MKRESPAPPAVDRTGLHVSEDLRARITALEAENDALRHACLRAQGEKNAILESALDCIVTIDQDSLIVEWNAMAEQTFGYARQAALGHDMAEMIIPPHYREAHRRGLARYLATGVGPVLGRRIEVEALHADGSTFPAELAITPTPVGGRTLFTAYLRNITEQRRAAAALRESEARFRTLADNLPLLCWIAEPDGAISWYNQRWYEYSGTRPEQMKGWGWQSLHDPAELPAVLVAWKASLVSGEPFEMIFPLKSRDGVFHPFLTRVVPIRSDGRIVRWFGTNTEVRDIIEAREAMVRNRIELEHLVETRTAALLREVEERRRAEEALRQGEKLQAIGQLTGGIAHDFNNILQVVASGTTLLRMPRLTEERRATVLDGLSKAAENAKDLTGRLLAFARKQALQPEVFDLNARLAEMSELLRQTLGSRIVVDTDFAPDLRPTLADPSQLEVAILNLAVNARDAMLPEGGVLTLQTRAVRLDATPERSAGEYVCAVVRDTGSGMVPTVLARVFEPFFTTKGPDKGTGLGLAQVHGFAKQSRGDISIESTPGLGTSVTIHLPSAPATAEPTMPPPLPLPLPLPVSRARETDGAALQRTAGKTVLVVEDNPDVADFAASMLEGLGYATRRAAHAAEALALLDAGRQIDAVFSDVMMPGAMNGLQLAATLRLRSPRLAVVLATGYSEMLAELDGQTVAEVLSKPYRLDDLALALARAFAVAEAGNPAGATPVSADHGPA